MRSNFTRWTCNACKTEDETTTDAQPRGWAGYGFTETGTPLGEMLEVGHLCPDCLSRVYVAMKPPATSARRDDTEETR